MFLAIGLIAAVAALAYQYFVWNFSYWKNKGVLGPKPIPLIGAFPQAFMQRKNLVYEVNEVYKKFRDDSPFIGYFAGRLPAVMLLDPKLIKDVLISNFQSFRENEFGKMVDKESDPIFARNPFMLEGDEWKEKRAEITPAFTNTKIKSMYPILTDVCKKMSVYLGVELKKDNENGLDAKELAAKFTTDVVSNCIYGIDSKSFTAEKSIIREMGSTIFTLSTKQIVYMMLTQVMPFLRSFWKINFVKKEVENFFTSLMNQAIKLRTDSKIERDDYLSHLLELQKKKNLQPIDMAAHTLTFFFDGFGTSSGVIAHILYRLASDAAVQKRLRTEISESIAKNGGITFDGLNEMKYLDQVINETQRISPIAAFISKRCTENFEFIDYKDKRVQIEKNTVAFIPIYAIHNDPQYYPNPQIFDPERFSEENGGLKKYRDMGVYLPFGDGPRICIGMRFAMLMMKAAIVEIISLNELTVNPKTQEPIVFDPKDFLLMPNGGIWLNFKPI